jgi:hypothetical protein
MAAVAKPCSSRDVRDHIDFVEQFRERVFAWPREDHVELMGG